MYKWEQPTFTPKNWNKPVNSVPWEVEAGKTEVQVLPGIFRKTLSKTKITELKMYKNKMWECILIIKDLLSIKYNKDNITVYR